MTDINYSDPNVTPPIAQAIPLGLQHVLAMFASNVTPSIIVAGAAGLAFAFLVPAACDRSRDPCDWSVPHSRCD